MVCPIHIHLSHTCLLSNSIKSSNQQRSMPNPNSLECTVHSWMVYMSNSCTYTVTIFNAGFIYRFTCEEKVTQCKAAFLVAALNQMLVAPSFWNQATKLSWFMNPMTQNLLHLYLKACHSCLNPLLNNWKQENSQNNKKRGQLQRPSCKVSNCAIWFQTSPLHQS